MITRRSMVSAIGLVALATSSFYSGHALGATLDGSQKPIRIIVPYPAGGPLDVAARALAEALTPTWKNVIVENKAGAGGGLAMAYAKRQPGDGHTLVIGAVATHAINPHLLPQLSYDPKADFHPITLIAHVPNVLVISPQLQAKTGIKTVADLIAYAKAHPGELNYASGSMGSAGHMAGELLQEEAGIKMVHIPYPGAAQARLSVLGGQTDLIFDNLASALPSIEEGKLIPLAVTTPMPSEHLPNVPTLASQGYPHFDISTWYGIFVPASATPDVVEALHRDIVAALESPDLKARLSKLGSVVTPTTPQEFATLIDSESQKYAHLIKLANVGPGTK